MDRKRGSYRTVQRFFARDIPWLSLNLALIRKELTGNDKSGPFLLAADATTVTKSGKKTHGLGRFFSSIYGRPVPGLSFECLSLIDVKNRKSWPLMMEQILPAEKPPEPEPKQPQKSKSGKKGRPKGSKNKNRRDVQLNAEMTLLLTMIRRFQAITGDVIKPVHLVYDGAFGNNAGVQSARRAGLHLISKLRRDSALYWQWNGEYSGRGRRPVYGQRIDFKNLPECHLKFDKTEGNIRTRKYQFEARHKRFADPLNVVVIRKENLANGKIAHIILFSSDLELGWENLIDYYSLRFQIEFNFRDAKQYWGLEDFMVIKEAAVQNAANLSMWMVNLSQALLAHSGEQSILDLKSGYRGLHYAKGILKMLGQNPERININHIPAPGRIHTQKLAA